MRCSLAFSRTARVGPPASAWLRSTLADARRHVGDTTLRPRWIRNAQAFLEAEILDRLSAEARAFAVCTSVVDRLSTSLAEALTGRPAAELLAALARENTFLVPIEDDADWFEYEVPLLEVLRRQLQQQLSTDEVRELHRKAATWLIAHERPEQALTH